MRLTIHPSAESIIKEFGPEHSDEIKGQIIAAGCWGFIEDDTIHCFYHADVSDRDMIELFAHEMSHKGEAVLKKLSGERFATQNAALFLKAWDLFKKIRK